MPIINSLLEFNKHVTVATNFATDHFLKFTSRYERKVKQLIGEAKYNEVVAMAPDKEEKILLGDYISNMALSAGLPTYSLNITNFGIFKNEASEATTADWRDKKDLNRVLLKTAFDALDSALQLIGVDQTDWKDLFVTTLPQFERYFSISGSYQTFLSLIPLMRESQDQFLRATLGDCYDFEFDEDQLNLIRAAIVNLTISKASVSGSFQFESNAAILRLEVLPWEKVEKVEQATLLRFQQERYDIAMGYLTQVQKFLKYLPCYVSKEYKPTIEKKPSGLYL